METFAPAAAWPDAYAPAVRSESVSTLSPLILPIVRAGVAALMVRVCDVDAALSFAALSIARAKIMVSPSGSNIDGVIRQEPVGLAEVSPAAATATASPSKTSWLPSLK